MTVARTFWKTIWHNSGRIKFLLDLGLWTLAIPMALLLRVEGDWRAYTEALGIFLLVSVPLIAFAVREFKFHRQSWAHLDVADMGRLMIGISMVTAALFAEAWLLQRLVPIPRSVPVIAGVLALFMLVGARSLVRAWQETLRARKKEVQTAKRVLIVGAGEAGTILVRELLRNPESGLIPVGFLDDDAAKKGLEFHGVPVVGRLRDMAKAFADTEADEALYTIPSAKPQHRREAFELAETHNIPLRMVPGIFDILTGDSPNQIREVLDTFVNRGKPQNVLLIGGAGYIGSGLIPLLLERGYHVRVLDNLLYGTGPIAEFLDHPRFEMMQGDFRQVNRVVAAMQGIDTVVHLGAIVGDPACALDEELTVEVNLLATKMVAEVARGYGVSRFLFASTCSVYGASDEILDEESGLNPVSLYARTKIASEKLLLRMKDDRFAPVILRFGTVYGFSGRTRFDLVVNLLTAKACTDGKITLFGGDQWRPFIHVRDVAKALLVTLEAPLAKTGGHTYNVGSDEQNYTLEGVAYEIQKVIPSAEVVELGSDADRRNYRVSFGRIREELGFVPDWTLQRGIQQVADAIASGAVTDYKDPNFSNVAFLTEEGLSKIVRKEFGSPLDVLAEDERTPPTSIRPGV